MYTFEFLASIRIIFILIRMPFHSPLLISLLDFILCSIWLNRYSKLSVLDLSGGVIEAGGEKAGEERLT